MMRDTERQIRTEPLGAKFVGDVVLTPNAVSDLLAWLQGQLGDTQLIAGSSLYRASVGADNCLAPAHAAQPLRRAGRGARVQRRLRRGAAGRGERGPAADADAQPVRQPQDRPAARPVAPSGWEVAAGDTPLAGLVSQVQRGAVVGRLSMGNPAANGDFSGVIKNSFSVVDGALGPALSEIMVTGNMARMLRDIAAVSRERIDSGGLLLPWVRIANLHFS